MRSMLAFVLLAACGGANAQATAVDLPKPDAQKTYEIRLSRPSKVGERTHVVMDQTEDKASKITSGEQVVEDKHERKVMHYDALSTVVAINETGRMTKTRHEVKELLVDGKPLVHGVVDITRAPKEKDAVILVDGAPASQEVRTALQSLLKLGLGGAKDDDIFGTKTPQAIGARWPINAQLAHDDLKDDTGIDAQTVTGEAWLQGTTRVGDVDCLDVRAKMGLDGISLPDMPPNSTIESGHMDADMTAALPIDGHIERAADHMTMKMAIRMHVQAPGGPVANVHVTFSETHDARFSAP